MADHSRVTEQEAVDAVAAADLHDIDFVEAGRFEPGGDGFYPAVHIIGHREDAPFGPERNYSTHLAVVAGRSVSLQNGTYDLTLDEAAHRLPR